MFISTHGRALNSELDRMNVEALWQQGRFVFWKTGVTMPSPPSASEAYEPGVVRRNLDLRIAFA